jgi:hypothetical protein
MTNLISPEALLDRARWGASPWAPGKSFTAGVGDLINQFVVPRRRHWYVTHSITNTSRAVGISSSNNAGIPLAQPADAALDVMEVDYNPASGDQTQEYVALTNRMPYAVDISGWKLGGGVSFTFKPGTVVPSNSVVYVSPDVRQFRARTTGPRGGLGLFVVGPYSGQLSARGETLTLKNRAEEVVGSLAYTGAPSFNQQFLRVTEIMYHPASLPGSALDAEEFEYLELRNISPTQSLDLTGVRFVGGVEFAFSGSAITQLAPGARVLVVGNTAAFVARYPAGLPVAGEYAGRLDNGGERLRLIDASNEEILDFEYSHWFPSTDGEGFSLEIVDESATPEAWSDKTQWRASMDRNGSPGTGPTVSPKVGAPEILVQPVAQTLIASDPITLSVVVTNTAILPLGIQVVRGDGKAAMTPFTFVTHSSHAFFLNLSGAETTPPWNQYAFVITNAVSPGGVSSTIATLSYLVDTDSDLLPDDWERLYLGGIQSNPHTDSDEDGLDNRMEYLAGTNPSDRTNVLGLRMIHAVSGIELQFDRQPGKTYSLQVTESLDAPDWRSLEDFPALSTLGTVERMEPSSASQRAYRLVTPRQP